MGFGLTGQLDATTLLWFLYLAGVSLLIRRLTLVSTLNTFSILLPLLLITNGFLVPFTRKINVILSFLEIHTFNEFWLGLFLMYSSIPVGMYAANRLFGDRPVRSPSDWSWEKVMTPESPMRVQILLVAIVGIAIASVWMLWRQGLIFDLISFAQGKMSYEEYYRHRHRFGAETRALSFYLYNLLPYAIAPIAIIMTANWKGFALWKRLAFFGVLIFTVAQSGQKMAPLMVLGYVLVSAWMLRYELHLGRDLWTLIGLLFLALISGFLPLLYWLQSGQPYNVTLLTSIQRIFLEGPKTLQFYFEVYPAHHPFLHGASSRVISHLMGQEGFIPPSVYVATEFLGHKNVSYPALFIGEAWADFAFSGVILASLFVGFLLQSFNRWFYGLAQPRLEEVGLFLATVFGVFHLLESNIFTSLLTFGLLANVLVYLMVRAKIPPRAAAP